MSLIYTKRGDVTKYGFRLGMTQTKCFPKHADVMSAECFARIEAGKGNAYYIAFISGRYARRTLYLGESLTKARAAFRAIDLGAAHVAAAKEFYGSASHA